MTFFNFNDIIQQMDKDELIDLLSQYRDLVDDANQLAYSRGDLIDTLQRFILHSDSEHMADRHYREKRRVIDKIEEELTEKYCKPVEEDTDKPYVGKRREAGCIDDFLVNEKETELIDNKTCKPIRDLKITLNDPIETTLTEAIPKL